MSMMNVRPEVLSALRQLKTHPRDTDSMVLQKLIEDKTGSVISIAKPYCAGV